MAGEAAPCNEGLHDCLDAIRVSLKLPKIPCVGACAAEGPSCGAVVLWILASQLPEKPPCACCSYLTRRNLCR
jgi:hypothetical protein